MTKTHDEMAHKFPQFNDEQLKREIDALNGRIVQMQKAKQRDKLPQLQRELHLMRMEHKRRVEFAKRVKYAPQPTQVD